MMIHRLAEMTQSDPGEEHAGSAQTYAMEFQTAERHPNNADERKHSNGVCDGLSVMQFEEPAHVLNSRLAPGRTAILFMSIISRV